jgi:hypothetical protein
MLLPVLLRYYDFYYIFFLTNYRDKLVLINYDLVKAFSSKKNTNIFNLLVKVLKIVVE